MPPTLPERQLLRARNGLAYLADMKRPAVAQSPRDLMWKHDTARLWRYRSPRQRYRPPVLIVHSLVSKSYVLDLLPNISMVRYLVGEGFDVFLLDWMPPDPADAENDEFIEGFLAISQWARDQVPFPGAAFRQTVNTLIRQNALAAGVIPLGRSEVRLKDIRCPFLNAFAEQDGITPAASSAPLTQLVGSEDASELRLQSGHIGFVAGRQAAKIARPQIADWIRRRSNEV
jgi:poly(3-hydroxyalkanoate) synthetase